MGKKKNKYYAVIKGHKPGIYDSWYGEKGAEIQIKGCPNALYKGFATLEDAELWFMGGETTLFAKEKQTNYNSNIIAREKEPDFCLKNEKVVLYTDGGCANNPGPGGFGVVMQYGDKTYEFTGGFRFTTNNRMELTACIIALKGLNHCSVTLFSDSKYVVDSITKGWAVKWQKNNWEKNNEEKALNADLWEELLGLIKISKVKFNWVKGHAGHPENERCDQLATMSAAKPNLPVDKGYKKN